MLNAREAMPNGGVVKVCAEKFRSMSKAGSPLAPGRYVKVSIADMDSGVPVDLVDENLRPLFHDQAVLERAWSGDQLFHHSKKHGGLLHLEKNSGEGATFTFYLPWRRAASHARSAPAHCRRSFICISNEFW